jgi:hypothetical protein
MLYLLSTAAATALPQQNLPDNHPLVYILLL